MSLTHFQPCASFDATRRARCSRTHPAQPKTHLFCKPIRVYRTHAVLGWLLLRCTIPLPGSLQPEQPWRSRRLAGLPGLPAGPCDTWADNETHSGVEVTDLSFVLLQCGCEKLPGVPIKGSVNPQMMKPLTGSLQDLRGTHLSSVLILGTAKDQQ